MRKFPQDNDQGLVAFLRQNRPVPPTESCDFEDKLMQLVEEETNSSDYGQTSSLPSANSRYYWAFPGVVAASLLFVWSNLQTLSPPKTAVVEVVELESFLVNSWNGVIGEVEPQKVNYSGENSWLLLSNLTADSQPLPQVYNFPPSHPQPKLHNVQYQN